MKASVAVAFAMLLIALALVVPDHGAAQQVGDVVEASGTATTSGSYEIDVIPEEGEPFSRSGTYEASVTFEASVTLTAVDVLAVTGSFEASGSFTAEVSAPEMDAFTVEGSYSGSGTFTAEGFTLGGSFTITEPRSASGTYDGSGTYDLGMSTASVSGTYEGGAQDTQYGAVTFSGPFTGDGSFALSSGSAIMNGGAYGLALAAVALQLPTGALPALATVGAFGPVAGTAIEFAAPEQDGEPGGPPFATPKGPAVGGRFSGGVRPGSIALLVANEQSNAGGIINALREAGCEPETLAILRGGQWKVYVVGAPDAVNATFPTTVTAVSPFFVRCE